jgi:hypothetical protein
MSDLPNRDGPAVLSRLIDTLRRAVIEAAAAGPRYLVAEEDRVGPAYDALLRLACRAGLRPPPDPVPPPGERSAALETAELFAWERDLHLWAVEAEVRLGGPGATAAAPKQPPPATPDGLDLVPGGFAYNGRAYDLSGAPRDMLAALLRSRYRRCGVPELLEALHLDDDHVEFPEQAVRDTAKKLRHALREALKAAGRSCDDPLPSTGRGEGLAYALSLP